jgi:hypothetical protein
VESANRVHSTTSPRARAGRMTSATSCARAALNSNASVSGWIVPDPLRSSNRSRIRSPRIVPPGSRTSVTGSPACSSREWIAWAWRVLPAPSGPSSVMNQPDGADDPRVVTPRVYWTAGPQPGSDNPSGDRHRRARDHLSAESSARRALANHSRRHDHGGAARRIPRTATRSRWSSRESSRLMQHRHRNRPAGRGRRPRGRTMGPA